MPPKKKTQPEAQTGTLHLEWFPAYGIRVRELPHLTVMGETEATALQNLARLGYYEMRDRHIDYNMVFTNDVFETD